MKFLSQKKQAYKLSKGDVNMTEENKVTKISILGQEVPSSLMVAISNIQLDLTNAKIKKSAYSSFGDYYYMTLDDLTSVLNPIANSYGVSVIQAPLTTFDDSMRLMIGVQTILSNKDGAIVFPEIYFYPEGNAKMSGNQKGGASLSYARRYQLTAIFNIPSEEDKDASFPEPQQTPKTNNQYQQTNNKGKAVSTLLNTLVKYSESDLNDQNKTIEELKKEIINKENVNDLSDLNIQKIEGWTSAIQAKMNRKAVGA